MPKRQKRACQNRQNAKSGHAKTPKERAKPELLPANIKMEHLSPLRNAPISGMLYLYMEVKLMETRTALIGIVVENPDSVNKLNAILHDYKQFIIGRMGLPHPTKEISIISIALDAPADTISALSGKLGALPGVNTKAIYTKC